MTKICVALLGATLLAGCDASGNAGGLAFLETPDGTPAPVITSARLANGQVTVSGPEGYCVDASTLRRTPAGGFAAIASCNILSNGQSGPIVEPVLVTVTVGRAGTDAPGLEDLANALGTELTQTRELSAVNAGRMASGGQTAFQGSDPRHWRGTFILGNRVVGLALYAPQGSPFVGAQGAAFLNTVSSRIRASSQVAQRSAEQSQATTDPLAAQLGRLFGRRDL
ncbi:dihydroxy-acid dehydratase [Marivita sp. S6314]|uniref:dihydroxy-acid dehydratase n=1 Tax=Marivita sp. S6314 TaxID=2926406 RepID=UPI001FF19BF1|nr:dihydroxy-acid dehydratase [Marivita sp. S6314]MCK0150299.1 dihydroxy-acid dehydratase [Marivita sp. S6314]